MRLCKNVINLFIINLLLVSFTHSQKVDTVINTKIYQSSVCKLYKQPLYVQYELHDGGGNCTDVGRFKNEFNKFESSDKDYLGSGYIKGHMVNDEDFSTDCRLKNLTFRYYNCLPQTPNLNKEWEMWENRLREESQGLTYRIISGGSKFIKKNNLYIPKYLYKIVRSSKGFVYCLWFTNEFKDNTVEELTFEELKSRLEYTLIMK